MAQLGAGSGTGYPGTIDTTQTWVNGPNAAADSNTRVDAELVNDFAAAILALENELGADPAGGFATVRARLDQYLPSSGAWTAGSVVFGGAGGVLTQDNANLFWDNANKRLGLGNQAPARALDVWAPDFTAAALRRAQSTNDTGAYLSFFGGASAATERGRIGYGKTGTGGATMFAGESADSLSLRAENALHLGARSTIVATMDLGMVIGSPTGGDKGAGTLNAQAVYDDNTLLTCYVFDQALDGEIDVGKWDETMESKLVPEIDAEGKPTGRYREERPPHSRVRDFTARAARDLDLEQFLTFLQMERHLPALPSYAEWITEGKRPMGTIVQGLWETLEVLAVHLGNLHTRLRALEGY